MKLEERDKRVLALIGTRPRPVSTLAAGLDVSSDELSERLADFADNGLVYDLGDGRYERTESGRRVLVTSSAGTIDERIDTSPEIEETLQGFAPGPDEADAVRHVYAFLRYWGRGTEEEIVDAIYSEAPAGRETSHGWWELVREPLAALPGIEPPTEDGEPWRYTRMSEASSPCTDGRRMLSKTHPVYGDVKHALESLDIDAAEREAARAAFVYLYRRGDAAERDVCEAVYPEHAAGYPSPQAWLEGVLRKAFEVLPGVERASETRWRYRRGRKNTTGRRTGRER